MEVLAHDKTALCHFAVVAGHGQQIETSIQTVAVNLQLSEALAKIHHATSAEVVYSHVELLLHTEIDHRNAFHGVWINVEASGIQAVFNANTSRGAGVEYISQKKRLIVWASGHPVESAQSIRHIAGSISARKLSSTSVTDTFGSGSPLTNFQ